jgi:hypothetical protein
LTMAEQAHRLEPSKSAYSMLLAQVYLRRSNTTAARQILESLTRDANDKVRGQAQSMLDRLTDRTTQQTAGSPRVKLGETILAEPVQPGSSRGIVAGTISSEQIRDGRTIDASGPMPTTDEVLARYVLALGGADKIKAVTSRLTKGTLDVIGVSRNGSFEVYALAPNKTLTVMQTNSIGTIKLGFNGQSGWVHSSSGLRMMKGLELETLQRDSDFYEPLRLKDNYARVTLLGKSKIGYREVYVLELQPASGPIEKLFVDAESFLPVRLNATRSYGSQMAAVEVYLDDWQTVDGIKFPFTITQSFPRLTLVFKTTEVKHGVDIDPKLFEPTGK